MTNQTSSCVLLAERHHGLRDSVRGVLELEFESVFMVANKRSLVEGVGRLKPAIVVLDLSLAGGDLRGLLTRITERSPGSKVLMLTVHDEVTVAKAAVAAGAAAVVLKSKLATDLLLAVDALRSGNQYISPELAT
ncbi:MAG TPA: response regulator [Woeseiaceae bacterium]|nr:response regulator [Woeseiaceae bacterium]